MKNPLKTDNNTALIAVLGFTALVAGAAAYLFLTEHGENTRKSLKKRMKKIAKNAAVKAISKKTKVPPKAVKAVADEVVK